MTDIPRNQRVADLARSAISAHFCAVRCAAHIPKEALMRIPALAILTLRWF